MEKIKCFAVTDQQVIIPLKEVSREVYPEDGITMITTEIDGECEFPNHCISHHEAYFKEMYLNHYGEPDKGNVFVVYNAAREWAKQGLKTRIFGLRRELRECLEKLKKLEG